MNNAVNNIDNGTNEILPVTKTRIWEEKVVKVRKKFATLDKKLQALNVKNSLENLKVAYIKHCKRFNI